MNKENLKFVRIAAISLSIMLGTLTLCNLLTVMTHGIQLDIPDENEYSWAIDPVEMKFLFMSQFSVKNKGAYDIDDIDIRANIITDSGRELLRFQEENLAVSRGSTKSFDLLVEIGLDNIELENWLVLLYRDTTLNLMVDIDAEYMFGLIHMTVDEVLEYPWDAPLGHYTGQGEILPWMLALIDSYHVELDRNIWDMQRMAVEYLMAVEEFEYSDDGYELSVMGSDADWGLRNLDCQITVPMVELSGSLEIDYSMDIGFEGQDVIVRIREVRIGYVSQ